MCYRCATERDGVVRLEKVSKIYQRGEGTRLWDVDGKEYLDFVAGNSEGRIRGDAAPTRAHRRRLRQHA